MNLKIHFRREASLSNVEIAKKRGIKSAESDRKVFN
jgi:hypothetical protein